MTPREEGFLLLGSFLGNPARRPLTTAQLRTLALRMAAADKPLQDRELTPSDLIPLGYGEEMATRIVALLEETELLRHYLTRGNRENAYPITRVSPGYPLRLRKALGLDSPGVLWAKGDASILDRPAISLVGSRDIRSENSAFAAQVGQEAARQGYVLISGNARGADRIAQEACLKNGGQIIVVVADELAKQRNRPNVLYLSEEDFDQPFTSPRALSRNRVIHALGQKTFVAQSSLAMGGTWSGTVHNLRNHWSPVYCFRDGSEAARQLEQMGAHFVTEEDLSSFENLPEDIPSFL